MSLRELAVEEFNEEINKDQLTVVKFWAPWCGPCKALTPVVEDAAVRHKDINFVQVNIDEAPELASQFHLRGIPAMLGFRNGGLVWQHMGLIMAAPLNAALEQAKA